MKKLLGLVIVVLAIVLGAYAWQKIISRNTAVTTLTVLSSPSVSPDAQPSFPKTLTIKKIGVNTQIESVGLYNQNRMDVPSNNTNVAWYKLGSKPGAIGNAVIDGHLDTTSGAPAVFWNLSKLTTGDEIQITDDQSKTYTFKVTSTKTYKFDQLPLVEIFGASSSTNLNLITCEGVFNNSTHNYSNRVVVYSQLEK